MPNSAALMNGNHCRETKLKFHNAANKLQCILLYWQERVKTFLKNWEADRFFHTKVLNMTTVCRIIALKLPIILNSFRWESNNMVKDIHSLTYIIIRALGL